MAIIGKLTQLDWFFKAYPMLKEAKDYMLNATNPIILKKLKMRFLRHIAHLLTFNLW